MHGGNLKQLIDVWLLKDEVSITHTATHHSRYDFSGRVISSSQRPVPHNTQHSQQTDIHAPGGIRTHDLSRRAAIDLRRRPRGHWDRQSFLKKLTVPHLVKFPVLCGNQNFITVYTRVLLSWGTAIQFMPSRPVSFWSILILFWYLLLGWYLHSSVLLGSL